MGYMLIQIEYLDSEKLNKRLSFNFFDHKIEDGDFE